MKQLSERVQSEFERWQQEYEIELGKEFQVKTLLQLQEEYNEIKPDSTNTRTRETILNMIKSLQMNLILYKKKEKIDDDATDKFVGWLAKLDKRIEWIEKYIQDKEDQKDIERIMGLSEDDREIFTKTLLAVLKDLEK